MSNTPLLYDYASLLNIIRYFESYLIANGKIWMIKMNLFYLLYLDCMGVPYLEPRWPTKEKQSSPFLQGHKMLALDLSKCSQILGRNHCFKCIKPVWSACKLQEKKYENLPHDELLSVFPKAKRKYLLDFKTHFVPFTNLPSKNPICIMTNEIILIFKKSGF